MIIKTAVLFLLILCLPTMVSAYDWKDTIRYNGFVTQGFIKTSDNNFFGDSTDGSFEFTEIGLNGSVRPSSRSLLSAQVLMRNAGEMYDADPAVDYALATYTLANSMQFNLDVSLGRFKNPFGFFNDTRDVAFTRPSTLLPEVIYFDGVRNAFLSTDGITLNTDFANDYGQFNVQLGLGRPLLDNNLEAVFLTRDWRGELEHRGLSKLARIIYESPNQKFRAAYSLLKAEMGFDPKPGDLISDGSVSLNYQLLSAEFHHSNWWLTAEYGWEPIKHKDFGPLMPDLKKVLEGFYIQGNYRLSESISAHVRYEEGYLDRADKKGASFEALTGLPGYSRYGKDWSIGLRWDISSQWLFMIDYHRVEGTYYLSPIENPNPADTIKDWNMLNMLVAWRF